MKTVAILLVTLSVVALAGTREELRSSTVTVASIVRQEPDGRLLYLKNCRTYHGPAGTPSDENKAKYPKLRALDHAVFMTPL